MPPRADRNRTKAMRTCRDALAWFTEYVEGGLTAIESRRLEAHLGECGACREFLDTLKTTREAVRRLRVESIPEECRRRLHGFLRKQARRGRQPGRTPG